MSRLADLQRRMTRALQSPISLASDPATADLASQIARGNERLTPVLQVDIYREQYFFRHLDAIAEDFPAVVEALGWDEFEELAKLYLAAHPPDSFSLRNLAKHLPAFLAARSAPAPIVDLAVLEWALVEAFDAADLPQLDPRKVADAGEALDGARLVMDPSMSLLRLSCPVHDVRAALMEAEHRVELPASRETFLVVYRRQLVLTWREVPRLAFLSLERLRAGRPLAEALDEVAASSSPEEVEQLQAEVGGWFGQWVQDGWIRDVVLASQV